MTKKNKISAIVLTKNSEELVEDCLKALTWVDEIIVTDNGSTDETVDIVKKLGAKVLTALKGSFSDLRNLGAKKAKAEWLLYIDADERVTPKLAEEIRGIIKNPHYNAYAIPRKNIVLGKELKHGGFGKFDYVKRLFKKDELKKWTGDLHEEPNYLHKGKLTIGKEGELGHLKNKMTHIKAETLSAMVDKTNEWSEIEARLMFEANHPPMNIPRFLSAMFREFWFRMVKKKAFLDGPIGTIHGIYQVFSRFVSYAKLWELQLGAQSSNVKA